MPAHEQLVPALTRLKMTLQNHFVSIAESYPECRYSAFDRELLAVFSAVKSGKLSWMEVMSVFTDHKPLIGAFSNSTPRISDKQQRQLSFISEFVVDIVHISGKDNIVAETLSRNIPISTVNSELRNHLADLPAIAKA